MHNNSYDTFLFVGSLIAGCLSIVLAVLLAFPFLVN